MIAGTCFDSSSFPFTNTLRTRWVIVQNRNIMANPLHRADRMFTVTATLEVSPPAKSVATRDIIRNRGAPGGCPTCSLKAARINSPQSQKLTVGSRVSR